ncbi:MAG: hypothetical protein K0S45_3299, partial [Nitrospira sp.]|nr:hypothetical protein [Nitrospira sp.]
MLAAYMVSHLTFILFLSVAPAEHAGEAADYKVLVTSHCCKNCYTGLPRSCANCGCLLRAMAAVGSDAVSDEITIHTETDKATGQAASADVQVKATPEVVKRLKDSVTKRGDFLVTSSGTVEDENLTLECV